MAKSGYCNGSDVLLMVNGKCVGHCTTHSLNCNSETKDRAVKPALTVGIGSGLWKEKTVTGLSISASASGLVFYNETECSYADLFKLWKSAKSIECKFFERAEAGGSTTPAPYCVGKFVITSLAKDAPAADDTTYSISLENDGEPTTLDESKLTPPASGAAGA